MMAEPRRAPQRFESVLFCEPRADGGGVPPEPDYFVDLNLDQVLRSMTSGREEYELAPFFYVPVDNPETVRYRHGVLHDLDQHEVLAAVRRFAEGMRRMRSHLVQADKLHYELQQQAWFVTAVEIYCAAVRGLFDDLASLRFSSEGFKGLQEYLAAYASSEPFTSLIEETRALKDGLAAIRYSVLIRGGHVTVTKYGGDEDYSEQVLETFARFRQRTVTSYRVLLPDQLEMNSVEARILDCVAQLYPEVFAERTEYCVRHRGCVDSTVARFDREIQFYLAYLELIARLHGAGLRFCYPEVSARSKGLRALDTFDLALAHKLISDGRAVVCNDLHLEGRERMFVVSGPNNGGKTTFARNFGQLHHLAGLGLPVPGSEARLSLPDRIFTHFEREEDIETLRGKFDDELVRVHSILEHSTERSVIVMNESFNSTTLNDALLVGAEVLQRILELGGLGVYVTFVDELASLTDATVSMVSQVVPEDPAERTFKVLRQPANGLAYAWAIADKYGLTYERVIDRVGG
jgi:DNA mismatch repair protein MutS